MERAPSFYRSGLVVSLLVHCVLCLLLLLRPQEGAQPGQRFLRQKQAGRDHRLAARDVAIAAALCVLGVVELKDMFLDITGQPQREISPVANGSLYRFCVLLDDGEGEFHL